MHVGAIQTGRLVACALWTDASLMRHVEGNYMNSFSVKISV
jgi:hypothetical protein